MLTADCCSKQLCPQALSLKEEERKAKADGVLWKTDDGHLSLLPCPVPGLDLPEAMYRSAVRDMRLRRYRQAASSLGKLSQSLALPPSLPPLSTLLLLRAQALMCGGEWSEGEEVCAHLMATLQPAVDSFLRGEGEGEGSRHTLTLAQAQWLNGLAALHRQNHAEAKQCWERYVLCCWWAAVACMSVPSSSSAAFVWHCLSSWPYGRIPAPASLPDSYRWA